MQHGFEYSFKRKAKRKLASEINVVPYIDVMLVLLVIFMVTAPLLNQGVQVNLPKVSSSDLPNQNSSSIATITLTANNHYYINFSDEVVTSQTKNSQHAIDLTEVIAHIQQKNNANNLQVFVRADENVVYAKAVQLIAGLQQAGIAQVGLVTQEP